MTEPRVTTKAQLMQEIDRAWAYLNSDLEQLTEEQLAGPRDAEGWTGKDHIIHLAAWERSVVYFLQGKPRHEGLGVDEALYLEGYDDAVNAEIHRQRKDVPLSEALAELRNVHGQLKRLLQPLTDADLQKPYSHYLPDEPGEGEGPPAINVIVGNTTEHFPEHMDWIRQVAGENAR